MKRYHLLLLEGEMELIDSYIIRVLAYEGLHHCRCDDQGLETVLVRVLFTNRRSRLPHNRDL